MSSTAPRAAPTERTIRSIRWGFTARARRPASAPCATALREHVILRTAWVYSAHGHNFVKTMLRLAGERPVLRVVADQIGSPTSAADIAGAIARIAQCVTNGNAAWGTYHFAGAGAVTWHGFAEAIFDLASRWRGPPPRVEAITTADYPTPARRPANSVLDCSRIGAAFGIEPRPWRAALCRGNRGIGPPRVNETFRGLPERARRRLIRPESMPTRRLKSPRASKEPASARPGSRPCRWWRWRCWPARLSPSARCFTRWS